MAGLSTHAVAHFERGDSVKASTVEMIQRALVKAGVFFIDASDGGPGARLRSSGEGSKRKRHRARRALTRREW